MKKMSELSTLCGIDACAIMYNPYEFLTEVWPSPIRVQQVLSKFKNIPKMEQSKKIENQESFLSKRIAKVAKQLKKHCKENWEKEMTQCSTTFVAKGSSVTPLNPQGASSLLSSSVVALAPMMMVTPEAMSRTSTEEWTTCS
ncbi:agamous-like MADS-box protein AGL80 [Gossypium australe]|uniref:Agamous-like MADS-box protein AGL80 n=1 Tax=Gossypium australe TaxID=47621 RepID=A0A5B6VIB3_9ROSI|nr:agamous-like MADS-box protein AGL80 [Gossypium australe]